MDARGFRSWSALHGDVEATGVVRVWLRFVYLLARPLVSGRVPPNVITLAGLVIGVAAVVPASSGGRWPLLAGALVGLSALLDGLDGAVALLTARVTRFGAHLDHACDRITEVAFAVALGLAGGVWAGCLTGATLALVHETTRSQARRRGRTSIGAVTVSERPTRVLVAMMFLLAEGVYPDSGWATAGAVTMTATGAIGLVQLIFVLRRA